jgi:ribosomal protein S12 methylthiotransferase accessory factor YcaO
MGEAAPAQDMAGDSVARLVAAIGHPGEEFAADLGRLDWVSLLPNAAAPGLVYLAGACGGLAVGGGGRDLAEAAGRLAGEAAETLARLAPARPSDAPGDPAVDALWGAEALRVAARRLPEGIAVGVPAGAIHGPATAPPRLPPRGLGLGAGPDDAAAAVAAILECVERDAVARWWAGQSRPRQLPAETLGPAAVDLAQMRGAMAARVSGLLALASPVGLPVVCAFSRDAGGRGLALGFKAATDPGRAATGAVIELLQMEIALEMARLRATRGNTAPGDAGPLARTALDPDALPAFAAGPPGPEPPAAPAGPEALAAHLAARGLPVTLADLGRPAGGLAVAKAFVPGLLPLPGPGPAPAPDAPGAHAEAL